MKLLTAKEAARVMHVHQETIRRWCRMGKVTYILESKREGYLIDPRSLDWNTVRNGYYTKTTGGRLRKLRKDMSLSLDAVAVAVHMDPYDLSMLERNKKQLTVHVLKKLCRFYEESADYILCMDLEEDTNEQ